MGTHTERATPAVELQNIVKHFGRTVANDDVSLDVRRGEAIGLLGENGAGKSTLMNILSGLYPPTSGQIAIDGAARSFRSPRDALDTGICMVHQHFSQIPTLSVVENVALTQLRAGTFVQTDAVRESLRELSARYRLAVRPDARVEELSIGECQRVEILKALYHDSQVLILDEPTSVLSFTEIDELLTVLDTLVAEGKSIVFISHKLDEVLTIASRIAVMRRGRLEAFLQAGETDKHELATLMVGERADTGLRNATALVAGDTAAVAHARVAPDPTSTPVVQVVNATVVEDGVERLRSVDLEVRAGEILGIAGVEGNGQRQLSELLVGLVRPATGSVTVCGQDVSRMHPEAIAELGVGYVPEDRHEHGLVMSMTAADNILLRPRIRADALRHGVLQRRRRDEIATTLLAGVNATHIQPGTPVSSLSGGNQQRVVLARELAGEPAVIVAAQPTRGLDFAATADVDQILLTHRKRGAAVVFISTNLDELLLICDRVAVLCDGEIVGVVVPAETTRRELGLLMGGQVAAAA